MIPLQVVLDTNVIVSGLRSNQGASYRLLELVGRSPKFEINLSVALVLEYEEILRKQARQLGLSVADVSAVIDYFCSVGNQRQINFLWRPLLPDPDDDLLLEIAVESSADCIVTFNVRDFRGTNQFGIDAVTPRVFLQKIEELS